MEETVEREKEFEAKDIVSKEIWRMKVDFWFDEFDRRGLGDEQMFYLSALKIFSFRGFPFDFDPVK